MSYYYPYFYKASLITFIDPNSQVINSNSANFTNKNVTENSTQNSMIPIIQSCEINNCQICSSNGVCLKCSSGWFLTEENNCTEICPEGFIADNLRGKCFDLNFPLPDVVFTKAYTFGSCKNNCFKKSIDCNCNLDCARKGDCCTDFLSSECDEISALVTIKDTNSSSAIESVISCEGYEGCEICEETMEIVESEVDLIYYPLRKKQNMRKRLNKRLNNRKNSKISSKKNINFRKIKINNAERLSSKDLTNATNNSTNNIGNSSDISEGKLDNTTDANPNKNDTNKDNLKKKNIFCRQCKENYMIFNGTCISSCPSNFTNNLYKSECVSENDYSLSK